MAQNVYVKLKMYKEAVITMMKQGRVRAGLDLARQRCELTKEDYIEILRSCPSLQLMHALGDRDNDGKRYLPIGVIIMTMIADNKFDMVLPYIQEMQNKPCKGRILISMIN